MISMEFTVLSHKLWSQQTCHNKTSKHFIISKLYCRKYGKPKRPYKLWKLINYYWMGTMNGKCTNSDAKSMYKNKMYLNISNTWIVILKKMLKIQIWKNMNSAVIVACLY